MAALWIIDPRGWEWRGEASKEIIRAVLSGDLGWSGYGGDKGFRKYWGRGAERVGVIE